MDCYFYVRHANNGLLSPSAFEGFLELLQYTLENVVHPASESAGFPDRWSMILERYCQYAATHADPALKMCFAKAMKNTGICKRLCELAVFEDCGYEEKLAPHMLALVLLSLAI